jgi:hypothetical protein
MKLSTIFIYSVIALTLVIVGFTGLPLPQTASPPTPPPAVVVAPSSQTNASSPPAPQIWFQDVTNGAGLSYWGASWGASWGDFNGDGWPDVWVSNHFQDFGLYLNQTDGTFINIITDVVSVTRGGDTHGAAWADFDNDGDQDLVQQAGAQRGTGQGPSQLYINDHGRLIEESANWGVSDPLGRGRTPLWLDWNGDGQLDLLLTNGERPDGQAPSLLFEQNDGNFQPVMEFPVTAQFAQLARLSGNNTLDLVIHGKQYPMGIYSHASWGGGWQDLTNTLLTERVGDVNDAVIADFNNDLHPDLYLARGTRAGTDIFQLDDKHIKARLSGRKDKKGFSFQASKEITVQMFAPNQFSLDVFIGSEGKRLQNKFSSKEFSFVLSSQDPTATGIKTDNPDVDGGVYIGYDPAAQSWQVLISSRVRYQVNIAMESSEPITNLMTMGFEPVTPSVSSQLLLYDQGRYKPQTSAGFGTPDFCGVSAVAGDFDNDMDLDIYLVCTRLTANLPNMLYENKGNGTFTAVPDAGGAAGTTGSLAGVGDSVSTVDYDQDGFLDLFVTNGSMRFYWGPNQLFRNQGNENHWLEVDLQGVVSNRDGIGARVLATAGGVTQLREQAGGMHLGTQNHQRLHFGLGHNTIIDRLLIHWPSGIVQELENVAADQILHVVEAGTD